MFDHGSLIQETKAACVLACLAGVLGLATTHSKAQLLPVIVPTPDVGSPTGVGIMIGGFESGIGNFTTLGEAQVTGNIDDPGGDALLNPTEGSNQLFLQTTGTVDNFLDNPFTATVAIDVAIDIFLDLPSNSIDGFVGFTDTDGASEGATEGSAARQTFETIAPTTLTFDYAFVTNELDQPSEFSDTAFFVLNREIFLLGNVEDDSLFSDLSPGSTFEDIIPFQTFTINLDPGIHTIGFGVVDVSDAIVNSGLLIDNVVVSPEPTSAAIIVLLSTGIVMRRRSS